MAGTALAPTLVKMAVEPLTPPGGLKPGFCPSASRPRARTIEEPLQRTIVVAVHVATRAALIGRFLPRLGRSLGGGPFYNLRPPALKAGRPGRPTIRPRAPGVKLRGDPPVFGVDVQHGGIGVQTGPAPSSAMTNGTRCAVSPRPPRPVRPGPPSTSPRVP